MIEHLSGHHKKLATDEDPATPLKGDSLYRFCFRSGIKGYYNCWVRETQKVNSKYADCSAVWIAVSQILENRMICLGLISIAEVTVIYHIFGL